MYIMLVAPYFYQICAKMMEAALALWTLTPRILVNKLLFSEMRGPDYDLKLRSF